MHDNRIFEAEAQPDIRPDFGEIATELYATLERIAAEKKVSVAWIVRDAAEKYVGDQWPLLAQKGQDA